MNIYIAYVWWGLSVLISVSSFIAFAVDKSRAKNGGKRIKEKTLLGLTVFGGAVGSFLGRIICRHKTEKFYFSFIICISLLTQILTSALIISRTLGVIK